ncbi:MAG: class I SAM-dependent methyltransferase, partial [Clostridia bacterium]|nr:class I SAM-dependent methyltransferase [Clostridia bacterium]
MNSHFENLVVCVGKGGQRDAAESFSRRTGAALSDNPGDELTLLYDANGVTLTGYGLSFRGDFEQMLHRLTEGRLQHEMLVHITKTKQPFPKAVDATAGMGEDSVLLAAAGYDVTMYEQNAVVAALL